MSSASFEELDNHGCAPTGQLLTASECAAFAAMWDDDQRFRSTIDMERYRFGRGVYRYFDNPLPPKIRRAACPVLPWSCCRWRARVGRAPR